MKTAEELFEIGEYNWLRCKADNTSVGYSDLVNNFGQPLVEVWDNDYQGDTRVLLRGADNRLGWLQFGWGSCSGCDALQACDTVADLQELMDHLRDSITWFADEAVALEFFKTHDWEGDYSWNSYDGEQKKFVEQVITYLQAGFDN